MKTWELAPEELKQLSSANRARYHEAQQLLSDGTDFSESWAKRMLCKMGWRLKAINGDLCACKPEKIDHLKTDWQAIQQASPPIQYDVLIRLKTGTILVARCTYAEYIEEGFDSEWLVSLPSLDGIQHKIQVYGKNIQDWCHIPK